MRKALVLAPALLALAAGCVTEEKATPAPVVVTPPAPAVVVPQPAPTVPAVVMPAQVLPKVGHGRIESITALPPSAAAGGGAAQRIGVKMDDGTVQYLDTSAPNLAIGDRIEITANGNLRR